MTKLIKPQPLKGFRDFYPEEIAFRRWLFGKMRKVSHLFGYQEYDGPILEPVAIYEAKSGQELVKKQTFQLKDRGGRKLALRPELTPTLARMVAQKQFELPLPIRWFSIGPRFRYEAPQKGRAREFYQWDVDLVGLKTPEADAEIISIACQFFKELGLCPKEVIIKVNNRQLMDFKLSLIEIKKSQIPKVFKAIDKNELSLADLSEKQTKELKKILADRDFAVESEELTQTFSTLKDLGVADFVEFDPNIVRGLDYYTGTVFEARDRQGKFRAILGGGRYDNLVEIFSKTPLSGVGFAAGDMVIEELLKYFNKYPVVEPNPTLVLVTVFDESCFRESLKLTTMLRGQGVKTEIYPDSQTKLDKQLKYADKKGIPYAIILGPQELEKNLITLKDLKKRTQQTDSFKTILNKILNQVKEILV